MDNGNPLYDYLYEKIQDDNVVGLIICSVEKDGTGGLYTDIREFTNAKATAMIEGFVSHMADLFLRAQEEELANSENKDGTIWN